MGVGRRMGKKQGMPEPLDESRFGGKGRKTHGLAGGRPKSNGEEGSTRGKKRRANGEVKDMSGGRPKREPVAFQTPKGTHRAEPAVKKSTRVEAAKPVAKNRMAEKKARLIEDGSDSDAEMNMGGLLGLGKDEIDEDLLLDSDDESVLGSDIDKLGDDFLGSGSSDDGFDSDEQEQAGVGQFSDEEDSDREEKLTAANIAGLSRRLDQTQEEEALEAEKELQESTLRTNIEGDRPKVLGDGLDDEDEMSKLAPDLQVLRVRITDNIRVLDDFSNLAEPGRLRSEYTDRLIKDICLYYGYSPYLAEKLFSLFPPREAFAFFEANESSRPVVIRTNTLRTYRRQLAQALINRGVTLEPVGKWSKVGLQIFESPVPLGATPEYLAGHYILQAASSFLPVMALEPQEGERVLDMAAAPGGKTTYMAAMMRNTGSIFANDSNKARAKGLIGNIHRLGVKNTIVCNYDAREFPKVIGGFDRVLLDAPCSGTGVIAKDASVKTNKTEKDFMVLPHLQKQLLLSAIDSVDHASKTGGFIVYSTCSVTVEENEQVVQYALTKRPNVKLVETGLTFGVDGFVNYQSKQFDRNMKLTKRFYPHKYNVDGFFVSKFQKIGPTIKPGSTTEPKPDKVRSGKRTTGSDTDGASSTDVEMTGSGNADGDQFGGWVEDEDSQYIEKSQKKRLRKKGLNPKSDKAGKKQTKAGKKQTA